MAASYPATLPISRLVRMFADYNPRRISQHDMDELRWSIRHYGYVQNVVINKRTAKHGWAKGSKPTVVGGHQGIRASEKEGLSELPIRWVDLDRNNEIKLNLVLNRVGGEFVHDQVEQLLRELREEGDDLEHVGFTTDEVEAFLSGKDSRPSPSDDEARKTLRERFLVPPFSVLDARQGYWRERKRAWIALGIQSEIGRAAMIPGSTVAGARSDLSTAPPRAAGNYTLAPRKGRSKAVSPRKNQAVEGPLLMRSDSGRDPGYYQQKRDVEKRLGRKLTTEEFQRDYYEPNEGASGLSVSGTSVFDPVLCELVYRWFAPPGGEVLDPFAGGSVRGIVAGALGRRYLGIDLRPEQLDANRAQAKRILRPRTPTEAEPVAEEEAAAVAEIPTPPPDAVTDPDALTPVERRGEVWVKRDDLFACGGARGSKARAAVRLLEGASGCTTAGSRYSPMGGRVARVAQALGIPCRVYFADSKELSQEEADAKAAGAELVKGGGTNYLRTLVAKARRDAEERGWVFVPLGLESEVYVEQTRRQAANLPGEVRRIVMPVGTGMALASVLHGLDDAGRGDVEVLGVVVGMEPEKYLERWAPPDWRDRVTLTKASSDFREAAAEVDLGGLQLDSHYEAKCLPFLEAGDLLWSVAISAAEASSSEPAAAPTGPSWARGYDVGDLRLVRDLFDAHERGLVFGAFGATRDSEIADWADRGSLHVYADAAGAPVAALVIETLEKDTPIRDFRGEVVATAGAGDVWIRRLACAPGSADALLALLLELTPVLEEKGTRVWLEHLVESTTEARVVAAVGGGIPVAWRIAAASTLRPVYLLAGEADVIDLEDEEWPGLVRLPFDFDVAPIRRAIAKAAPAWEEHYSHYNERGTWLAVALRGYGGRPEFIEKPSEMSRKWKRENPDKLQWEIEDTPLRAALRPVEKVIRALGATPHRIRLMRLLPGGGLGRHADITDPDAGVSEGKLLRIHVPIETNEGVVFESWQPDGVTVAAHMERGSCWYLDTRKPHRARNAGESERVHLVLDVEATPELVTAIAKARMPAAPREVEILEPSPDALSRFEIRRADVRAAQASDPIRLDPRAGAVQPEWRVGDSRELTSIVDAREFDLVFTCPPYYDLERYSGLDADLSNAETYEAFLEGYAAILRAAAEHLRDDRFCVLVVGEVREKTYTGGYAGLIPDTIRLAREAGLTYYNEAILVTSAGSLPVRVGRQFEISRKLGKTHQNVLVFVKGDWKAAAAAIGPVEFGTEDPAAASLEEDLEPPEV